MKKFLSILTIAAFLACGSLAMAVEFEGPGIYEHSVTHKTQYFDKHPGYPSQWTLIEPLEIPPKDEGSTVTGSYVVHPWHFTESLTEKGNDFGYAGGDSMIGGEMETYADAEGKSRQLVHDDRYPDWMWWKVKIVETPNAAFEQGLIYGTSKTKAWSWAHDSGLTSKAGAGIKADNGFIIGEGLATGKSGEKEFVSDRIVFGASFYQENGANEIGYLSGGIGAYNQSGLDYFAVSPWDMNEHSTIAINTLYSNYTPDVITKGKSEVTIQPYGDNRSFKGATENMTNIAFNGCHAPEVNMQNARVFGNGIVSGGIQNGNAYAGGTTTFNYNGYTAGNGSANLVGNVTVTPHATSAFVSGSSRSVANGAE